MQNKKQNNRGYSLIEMSAVLGIIAVVVGMSLTAGDLQLKVAAVKNTSNNIETVKQAILLFENKTGRYPCPASETDTANYGKEATGCDTSCPAGLSCAAGLKSVAGMVPFKTLGLAENLAYDSNDFRLTYVVDKTNVVHANMVGALDVRDVNDNPMLLSATLGKGVFAVISHGQDEKGAYDRTGTIPTGHACVTASKDGYNCDRTTDKLRDVAAGASNSFDDQVAWSTQPVNPAAPGGTAVSAAGGGGGLDGTVVSSSSPGGGSGGGLPGGAVVPPPPSAPSGGELVLEHMVAAGNRVTVIASDGQIYSWGQDQSGSTGTNCNWCSMGPTAITGPAAGFKDWVGLTGDTMSTCGIRLNGDLWCWGLNNDGSGQGGQVGDGTFVDRMQPVGVALGAIAFTQVSSDYWAKCGISSAKRLYCWGLSSKADHSNFGYLAATNNFSVLSYPTPTEAFTDAALTTHATDWLFVHAGDTWTCGIRTGTTGTTSLLTGGEIYCWGSSYLGAFGNGSTTDSWTPVLAAKPDATTNYSDWKFVNGAYEHVCGIRGGASGPAGHLYCWGHNDHGGVGNGLTSGIQTYAYNVTIGGVDNADWLTVTPSIWMTCGIRGPNMVTGGELWCWGDGADKEMPTGTAVDQLAPVKIGAFTDWVSIEAEDFTMCGMRANKTLYCWGDNSQNQLRNGSPGPGPYTPQLVNPGLTF